MAASPGRPGPQGAPPMPKGAGNSLLIMMVMFFAIFILFTPEVRLAVGSALNVVFLPTIGFNGTYPILTLLITGSLMILFSTVIRHLFMDWVSMARNQKIISAFQKEFRKARLENNMYKIKKLNEIRMEVTAKSMSASQTQMKLMPVTMIVIIPIFAWLSVFVVLSVPTTTFSVPWTPVADMLPSDYLFPNWVLLYSLLTLSFAQVISRILKYFSFKKRLEKLELDKGVTNASGN